MIIYLARNKTNGKGYVGLTINGLEARKKAHEYYALKGVKYPFYKALRKYGFDAFEWTILEVCYTIEWLKIREQYWVKKLKTKAPNGYNLTDGGDGLLNPSKEIRKKISEGNKGKKPSKEVKKKQSESAKRKWKNPEYKENHSGKNHVWWNRHHKEETKKKQSEARKKWWKDPKNKKKIKRLIKRVIKNHADLSGENAPMYGKGYLIEGNKNGMYDKHHKRKSKKKISRSKKKFHKNNPNFQSGENHWMYKLESKDNPNTGSHRTKEQRKHISKSHMGIKPNKKTKRKQSKSMKEKWKDPKFREKMKGKRSGENNPMYGVPSPMKGRRKIDGIWYSAEEANKILRGR